MNHLTKKTKLQGAGGKKPKPQSAVLNPPKLGKFNILSSYGVAEIIDLISDGPIEGLVDQNGKSLIKDIFKGVYLDSTPVQNTEQLNQLENQLPDVNISIAAAVNDAVSTWVSDTGLESRRLRQGSIYSGTKKAIFLYRKHVSGFRITNHNIFSNVTPSFQNPSPSFQTQELKNAFPDLFTKNAPIAHQNTFSTQIELHYKEDQVFRLGGPISNFESRATQLRQSSNSEKVKKIASDNLRKISQLKGILKRISISSVNTFFSQDYLSFFVIPIKLNSPELVPLLESGDEVSFQISKNVNLFFPTEPVILIEPAINSSGIYTGEIEGLIVFAMDLRSKKFTSTEEGLYFDDEELLSLADPRISLSAYKSSIITQSNELFNFSNISCQFKNGEEFQEYMRGFEKVFNDFFYETELLGPFKKELDIQRLLPTSYNKGVSFLQSQDYSVSNSLVLRGAEGSRDVRTSKNYSDWNNKNESKNYISTTVTHTVENPLAENVIVSVIVNTLSDTAETVLKVGGSVGNIEAGAKLPSVVHLQIETGKITNGEKTDAKKFSYIIAGLVEGGVVIDFGGRNDDENNTLRNSVKLVESDADQLADYLSEPFELPPLEIGEDPTTTKRYVKVSKLSAETNSVLINKSLSLLKVTEIIDNKLSYPFSAVAGIKLDARAFSSIPERSFDCRLKKVKIPTNYFPLNGAQGTDKRYVTKASSYNNSARVYVGDWDGSMKLGWTDNPAWILYDLLTSKRYGLGAYIDESQVNKWELYKIARFCDAVDDRGFFVGVSDGVGGLEPRYSCNIMFKEQTKIYDAINIIANLFRGVVFFGGSEIHFLDDRPRTPIALFSNTNVKDGLFNYGNTRRDQQFNTIEVVYLDRFDNYKTKVEYIQDESDIRKRGVFKTTINTMGVTSRAMARRIGQHIIYQTTKENQTIDFAAGLESLLCRPGDLIIIEDEMKTRSSNYGRVLQVDTNAKTVRIDNQFQTQDFTGFITLYSPQGYTTSEDLGAISQKNRGRVDKFTITGNFLNDSQYNTLQGEYFFSGYTSGFPQVELENDLDFNLPEEFPLYTGKSSLNNNNVFCYYNTGATGFVFATGLPFQNNNVYDKIITNTGVLYGVDFSNIYFSEYGGNYTGFQYQASAPNRRGSVSGQISGAILWDASSNPLTRGILDEEIDTYNITQIAKLPISGFNNLDYGSLIYLDQNEPSVNLISFVKEGSPYRLERKNASDQIYKILSIRENSQNEYAITASRYDTGKFEQIEKFITEDFLQNTFYRGPITLGNVNVKELDSPFITQFTSVSQTTSGFSLSGQWSAVTSATGYSINVFNKLGGQFILETTSDTKFQFDDLRALGNWNLEVLALGNGSSSINSLPSKTGVFVAYQSSDPAINTLAKPAVINFTLE